MVSRALFTIAATLLSAALVLRPANAGESHKKKSRNLVRRPPGQTKPQVRGAAANRNLPRLAKGLQSATAPRVVKNPDDPRERRVAKLREQLESILQDRVLRRSRIGVEVMAEADGDILFSHNAEKLFNPASNTKLLTTGAALTFLGVDFRYATGLYGPPPDEEGVIHGDVELRGSGDPSLSSRSLLELASQVRELGVTKIDGAVFVDGRFHDSVHHWVAVGDQALILNRNTYLVRVRPTSPRQRPTIEIEPPLPGFFALENAAVTVAGRKTRLRIDSRRGKDGHGIILTVRGRINDRSDFVTRRRVADGAPLAGEVLRKALIDLGVNVVGPLRFGSLMGAAPLIAEHRSASLADICRVSNKDSNNFVAEAIFRTVGGALFGLPGTLAKGTRAVDALMAPLRLSRASYTIVNGSGLTHANRIQPSGLVLLLRYLGFDLAVAPEFLSSLAVAGIDGTIRGRFLGTRAVGLVRAKTGTLSGVSTLSGYVGDIGDVLIFSIMVEGFRHRAVTAVRQAQVRMVEAMLAFLRTERPQTTPSFLDQSSPAPFEDSESDGDPEAIDGR